MLWYRAKTYCPVIESLRDEPEKWATSSGYSAHKAKTYKPRYKGDSPYLRFDYSSLYHIDLNIEIADYARYGRNPGPVKRNNHELPVNVGRLKRALALRAAYFEAKKKAAALAELNRVTQDAQTLRLARITTLRKELAEQEAADIAYRIENA